MSTWKNALAGQMPEALAREIDVYETQLELKRQGKVEDNLFNETRLRRGVYGQRYDNGQRHDGVEVRTLEFDGGTFKGPDTLWDAPGMQRIKVPYGGLNADQMDLLADLAEEYSDAICHITTRQDVQLHYVHIDDTPDLMRRLSAAGITTREACGNAVRNVTACPLTGVCHGETFDVTPHARALTDFLIGHPDAQDFGRKVKPAFSGCAGEACGLVKMHDIGFVARTRSSNGSTRRGFTMYVGGGLGAVPYQAKVLEEFLPETEILPYSQAVARVFARLGEKRSRGRARMKFLVDKLGIDRFRELVREERAVLPHDPAWTDWLDNVEWHAEVPAHPATPLKAAAGSREFAAWYETNVYRQRQPGYVVATVSLPLGDIASWQLRELARIARRFVGDTIRSTVEQNIVLRWVSEGDLPALHAELRRIGLASSGAGTILDVTACPGTDTCKLGIASSRGLAAEISERLAARAQRLDQAIRDLRIKISGCFNSCGQHHLADLGFYGVSRKVRGTTVPHFRIVLGGQSADNAGAYGLTIGAVPSKAVPEFIDRIAERYLGERERAESFQQFAARLGKRELKRMVDELATVPPYEIDASYYSDWRDPREFTTSDIGTGECAGAVVERIDFDLQAAERQSFEAQIHMDEGDHRRADEAAYAAMLDAARGLLNFELHAAPNDADGIVAEFKRHFYDTEIFFDRFAKGKFAQYLLRRHSDTSRVYSADNARHIVEEAQLFIEAAYACHGRLLERRNTETTAAVAFPSIRLRA